MRANLTVKNIPMKNVLRQLNDNFEALDKKQLNVRFLKTIISSIETHLTNGPYSYMETINIHDLLARVYYAVEENVASEEDEKELSMLHDKGFVDRKLWKRFTTVDKI